MTILEFLFYLGIINIVFGFIWKWAFVFPTALLFTFLKMDRAMLLVKTFGAYLLVSLTALLTLTALEDKSGFLSLIGFPLVGGFVIYMGFASNAYEAQKQARTNYDDEMLDALKYDGIFIFGAPILFIISLFFPIITVNRLILWLYNILDWVYNLPVIGWLIKIGGVLFLISIIFNGIVISGVLFSALFGKRKQHLDSNTNGMMLNNNFGIKEEEQYSEEQLQKDIEYVKKHLKEHNDNTK
ncbi:MAG: hypothetical protein FJ240_07880 [Nitrospira sp.]|nr:hypothetical protein [Nitrospira sp.]